MTRLLVADDHPALLKAVTAYLGDHGFEIVGEAESGDRAVAIAAEAQPDVALIDYRIPRIGGAELVRRLKEASPETHVAVYTAEAGEGVVAEVLEAGASAVILKEAPLADIVRALTSIVEGRPYVDAALAAGALSSERCSPVLTQRETQVLRLLADGLSHEQVGQQLQISAETARTHLRKACRRLGAATRTEAVARAIRLGLIA